MTAFVTLSLGPCSYVYIYIYMCVHAYIYIDLYLHIFTYLYFYIHTYVHIYIYIHTWYMVNVEFEMWCFIHAWLRRSIFKILAGPQVEGVESPKYPCISPALGEPHGTTIPKSIKIPRKVKRKSQCLQDRCRRLAIWIWVSERSEQICIDYPLVMTNIAIETGYL